MDKYEELEMEVISFDSNDVIITSNPDNPDEWGQPLT